MVFDVLYIILALIAIGVLIFIHELGHYFMAKKVGMKIEAFSIGFGPAIKKWKRNDVDWKICILPFGGYVRISGMESKEGKEPHEIKDGFFGKKPLDRIKVAVMGPLVNFVFAFLLFIFLWSAGGRTKTFSEYTKVIGWVDPKSELYEYSVKPGDEIIRYDGKKFNGYKDLLYASVINQEMKQIQGYKIDYYKDSKEAFDYTLKTYNHPVYEGLNTIGVFSLARYLIYDRLPNGDDNPLPENSPMIGSGIQYGDRILWVDGNLIFSAEQLSNIINKSSCFLTIKRNNKIFHTNVDRVKIEDLKISKYDLSEIDDWRHEKDIKEKIQNLFMLPYYFNDNCVIESQFDFVDEKEKDNVFKVNKRSLFNMPLERGDTILAIDGYRVNEAADLLVRLQDKRAVVIIDRSFSDIKKISWKNADKEFSKMPINNLVSIISTIGTSEAIDKSDNLHLLKTVEPKTLKEINFSLGKQFEEALAQAKKRIENISDPEKKEKELKVFEETQKMLVLGLPGLSDRKVRYNPNPATMFYQSFTEIWKTLVSFVSGHVNPKFLIGPVGIVQSIKTTWSISWKEAFFWIGVISLNLGFLNLLPIPVFDGGHILFSVIEMITKKPIKAKTMERLVLPFVILLIAAFIFMTYHDLHRIFVKFWE